MNEPDALPDVSASEIRTLAVCVNERPSGAADDGWEVLPVGSLEDMVELAKTGSLDAVAYHVDPLDLSCRPALLRLVSYQKQGRPVLVSYSKFNPSWIENFVFGAGANIHIRGHLDLEDVTNRVAAHMQTSA